MPMTNEDEDVRTVGITLRVKVRGRDEPSDEMVEQIRRQVGEVLPEALAIVTDEYVSVDALFAEEL